MTPRCVPTLIALGVLSLPTVAAVPARAQQQRSTPPPPSQMRTVSVPTPAERTLPNGLRVIHAPRAGSGLVSVQFFVRAGGANDPDGKAGLAALTASLVTQGAGGRPATRIAEQIEALGGSLSGSAGRDATSIRLSLMRRNLEPALPVLADVVIRPDFPAEELERQRTQTLDALAVELGDPSSLGRAAADRVIFGAGPYGPLLSGTPASLKGLTREDVVSFSRAHFLPRNTIVIVAGDIAAADAFRLIERHFGGWKAAAAAADAVPPAAAAAGAPATPRVLVVDKPDAGQAAVFVTRVGIARSAPEYLPGQVANTVLGVGFSSRLNQEIRIKRGLSYGAASRLEARRLPGPFRAGAQTKNESAAEVAALMLDEIQQLGSQPVPAAELTTRKAVLSGAFSRDIETGDGLASRVADLAVNGLPLSNLGLYLTRVQAVSPAQVAEFTRARLSREGMSVVIVGNAAAFLPALKQRFGEERIEVIPEKSLNLDSATLK